MPCTDEKRIEAISGQLFEALYSHTVVDPLTAQHPELTIADSYRIQQQLVARRIKHGERVIGKKIGVSSPVAQKYLGAQEPDYGVLFDSMVWGDGAAIPIGSLIQPRVEGEIAFVLKRDLLGPGLTIADVLRATGGVISSFEIIDSRIRDWKIKIQDTVADNASCGAIVLGDRLIDIRDLDLRHSGMVLEINGEVAMTGAGAATMGSPVNAVVWLANTLGKHGISLKAGEVILTGALGAPVAACGGDNFRVTIGGVGSCSFRFSQ